MAIPLTTLTASANPSVCGQHVTFAATVTPAAGGPPTGTVDFVISAAGPALTAPVIPSGTIGVASLTVHDLSVSPPGHVVVATYSGDGNVDPSTSVQLVQTITKAGSATVLTALPSLCGEPVVFKATVTAVCPSEGIPGGAVLFVVPGVPVSSVALVDGVATFTAAPAGAQLATAVYSGDDCFVGSLGTLPYAGTKAATLTTLTSGSNPSTVGQPVTFSATVTATAPGTGTPAGAVRFSVDGGPGTPVTLSGGHAVFVTGALTSGSHPVVASYGGDDCFAPSTSTALTQIVAGALNTTTLTALPAMIRLRANGTFFVPALNAALTNTTNGTPVTGRTVTFLANPSTGPVTLGTAITSAGGVAILSEVSVSSTLITAGHYTARFAGGGGFTPSTTIAPLTFQPTPVAP
jgi:hypothetical protein